MELNTLRAQIRAARHSEAKADGVTFSLDQPSDHAFRTAMELNRDKSGLLLYSQATRFILSIAITGWEGLTARHFLPEAPDEAITFSAQAREELLDVRQDIADELMVHISSRIAERRETMEAARKN